MGKRYLAVTSYGDEREYSRLGDALNFADRCGTECVIYREDEETGKLEIMEDYSEWPTSTSRD